MLGFQVCPGHQVKMIIRLKRIHIFLSRPIPSLTLTFTHQSMPCIKCNNSTAADEEEEEEAENFFI